MIHAKINYKTYDFPECITILDALRSLQIELPTLCHDDRLQPCGSCRHVSGGSTRQFPSGDSLQHAADGRDGDRKLMHQRWKILAAHCCAKSLNITRQKLRSSFPKSPSTAG